MMTDFLAWLIAFPAMLALGIFSVETLFGLRRGRRAAIKAFQPRAVILMPAHNEAATISATLDKLSDVLSGGITLLVVADNCTDSTALIVRGLGHRVIERDDPNHKGKGFALAFGRDFLQHDPPQCVVVFDADCETDPESIRLLTCRSLAEDAAVQARYILKEDRSASPKVQISNFAFWLKNVVRQRGQMRLGGPAILAGTGMAFPWRLFTGLPLATSNIVEDLALGIFLTQNGQAPIYLDEAVVLSSAANERATLAQRTRWEHGFVTTAKQFAFSALWHGILRGNRKLFQLGMHLLVPPLVLLFIVAFVTLSVLFVLLFVTGSSAALLGLTVSVAVAGGSVLLAWCCGGKRWLSFGALLHLPFYFLWKVPILKGLAVSKAPEWNRTERNEEGSDS